MGGFLVDLGKGRFFWGGGGGGRGIERKGGGGGGGFRFLYWFFWGLGGGVLMGLELWIWVSLLFLGFFFSASGSRGG